MIILSHRAPVALALLASSAILAMSCSARAEESAAPLVPAPSADRPSSSQRDRARVAVVGGVGFPRPLAIEALFGVNRILAIGLEYSFLPVTSVGGIDTSFYALAGDARFFPFRNSFFLGLRGGHQHLGRSATLTVPPYGSFHGSIDVDTWFINPRAGFLWMWESGLAIGSDVGVQIPARFERFEHPAERPSHRSTGDERDQHVRDQRHPDVRPATHRVGTLRSMPDPRRRYRCRDGGAACTIYNPILVVNRRFDRAWCLHHVRIEAAMTNSNLTVHRTVESRGARELHSRQFGTYRRLRSRMRRTLVALVPGVASPQWRASRAPQHEPWAAAHSAAAPGLGTTQSFAVLAGQRSPTPVTPSSRGISGLAQAPPLQGFLRGW